MTKHTAPHCRFTVVNDPEKRSPLFFLAQSLPKFQISLTETVNEHKIFILKIRNLSNMGQ